MRYETFAFRCQGLRVSVVLFVVWCVLAPGLALGTTTATVSPTDDYPRLITASRTIQPLGQHPFGEQISLYDGDLSFKVTDVSVPGIGPTLQVSRSLGVGAVSLDHGLDLERPFGDWELDIPRIETMSANQNNVFGWFVESYPNAGYLDRCTLFGEPPPVNSTGAPAWGASEWWYGYNLIIPGQGSQKLMSRSLENTLHEPANGSYPIITKNNWEISCGVTASDGGEGFKATAPDGTVYTFSHLVYSPATFLQKPLSQGPGAFTAVGGVHPLLANVDIIARRVATMYVTKVEDRFGNALVYTWNGDNLSNIKGYNADGTFDGREVDFAYDTDTRRIKTITLQPAGGASARVWTYSYGTTAVNNPTLTEVLLPDGTSWSYQFGSMLTAQLTANYYDCINTTPNTVFGGASGTATAPSGLTATFTLQAKLHGRSYVVRNCVGPIGAEHPTTPNEFAVLSLTKETLTGPGIQSQTWNYSYSAPNQSWTIDACATGKSCADTVYTDVEDPLGNFARYTFSNKFDYSEGQLLRADTYKGAVAPANLVRSVANTYARLPPLSEPWTWPWPAEYGFPLQPYTNHDQINRVSPLLTRTISQDGATFTTTINTYNDLVQATNTKESSSLGYSKTETTSYLNDAIHWVLGLVTQTATQDNTGSQTIVDSQTSYDGMDLPTVERSFGRVIATKVWNDTDGTLTSVTDGDNHTTTFSGWYRGVPKKITYADGTAKSATVNGNGWLTSLTDENGFTTNYAYDPMGRLTSIAYPTGDDVAWTTTQISLGRIDGATYAGIPNGVWVQSVHTALGDHINTYLDAFWRPIMVLRCDSAVFANTVSNVVMRYDAAGRLTFRSYPIGNITDYTAVNTGTHYNYDALGRVTEADQDSELGSLPTTTQYLTGFKTAVTKPNQQDTGISTVTSYQAYGTPTMQWPVSIAAPMGEVTTINRDVFGKPTSITRSGSGLSHTRSFAYNSNQELCGRTEPETGTTMLGYDGAGNLAWSVPGLPATAGCYNLSQAQASGRMIARSYDVRNRLTGVTYPDGFDNTTYTYAPDGVLTRASVVNSGVSTAYAYDKRRLLTQETLSIPHTSSFTLTYGYDANGHLAGTIYPDGRTINYAPNALGQPTQAGSYATGVQYYPNGAISGFTYGNHIVHAMAETMRGLVGHSTDVYGSTTFHDEAYDYDGDGNVAAITTPGNTDNVSMTYDALDRLAGLDSAAMDGHYNYSFDAFDNLAVVEHVGGSTDTYHYDASNRLVQITNPWYPTLQYTYDAQGNLAQKNTYAYQFDMANRLRNVPGVASYLYDAAGRRVQKVETEAGTKLDSDYSQAGNLMYQWNPANANSTDYIYLGSTLVARVVGNKSTVIGAINGVTIDSTPLTQGWACSTGIVTPINVEVFAGGPSGGGGVRVATATADQPSVPATTADCGTDGTTYGFSIPLGSDIRAQYAGEPIYMYGDSPVGNGNNELQGSGTYSVPPNPGAPPSPAQIVVPATSSTGAITVSWSSSTTATNYVLEQRFNGGAWTQAYSGAATSASLSGLGNGKYVYRVRACNDAGCSGFTVSATLTVALIPAPPASITVPASSFTTSIGVSWNASANATNYVLEESVNGGAWGVAFNGNATSTTVTVSGSGTYKFQVSACGAGGCSGFTTSGNVVVTLRPASAPSLSGPSASNTGTYTLSWSTISGATRYQLNQNHNGTVTSPYNASGTSWSSSGLGNDTYGYQVFACNAAGCGPGSNGVTIVVTHPPASAPALSGPSSSSTGTYTLSWTGVATATRYQLNQSINGGAWAAVYNSSGGSWTSSGLGNGTYAYQVFACNVGGCSPASGTVTVHVLHPPPAPHLSGPTSSVSGTFTLSWNTVSTATRYQLNQNHNGSVSAVYNAAGTSWSSSALGNGTYNYQVYACNGGGCTGSNGLAVKVLHIPPTPSSVTVPTSVPYPGNPWAITIAAVSGASSYNLRRTLESATGAPTTTFTGVSSSTTDYTVPGTYQYAAQACNASGCSGWRNASHTTNVFCAEGSFAVKTGVSPDILKCGGLP